MKTPPASLVLKSLVGALLCSASPLVAQTVTFGSISETPTDVSGGLNQYRATIGGVQMNLSYPAYNVTVTDGADGGEILIGQNFLAVCVNVSYPGLTAGTFGLSTDGSSLSYDIDEDADGFDDSWTTLTGPQRASRYNAIRDVVATFSAQPTPDGDTFQYMITALNFALAEISVDGIADTDPLNTGDMQFSYFDGTPFVDPDTEQVLFWFNTYMAAIGAVDDNDLVLYSAGVSGYANQDVILIPVPEPSAAFLAGAAGLLGLVRRRRR